VTLPPAAEAAAFPAQASDSVLRLYNRFYGRIPAQARGRAIRSYAIAPSLRDACGAAPIPCAGQVASRCTQCALRVCRCVSCSSGESLQFESGLPLPAAKTGRALICLSSSASPYFKENLRLRLGIVVTKGLEQPA